MHFWHAPAPERLVLTALDSLTLLYDRASGQTHLLATPSPEILAALAEGAATVPQLLGRLRARFDLDGDSAEMTITARLEELAALGLVEAR